MRSNFKHIVTILLFTTLMSSCVIDDGDRGGKKTEQGFFVYAYTTDNVLSQFLFCLDAAIKIDDCSEAEEEQEKDKLEDLFFPKYKVRQKGDTTVLVSMYDGGDGKFDIQFLTGGIALGINHHWSVLLGDRDKWVDIYRDTDSEYRVEASEVMLVEDLLLGSTNLVVSVMQLEEKDKDKNSIYSYSISGKGSYMEKGGANQNSSYSTYSVEYVFEDKLVAYLMSSNVYSSSYANKFRYYDGALSMTLSGEEVEDAPQSVKALLGPEMYIPTLEITYKGVTETWELFEHRK